MLFKIKQAKSLQLLERDCPSEKIFCFDEDFLYNLESGRKYTLEGLAGRTFAQQIRIGEVEHYYFLWVNSYGDLVFRSEKQKDLFYAEQAKE